MLNTADMTEVPLGIFAGNNTELLPTDLPAGLSPASCDVGFLPGSVFTRPAQRRYNTLGSTHQIVYAKSFVTSDGSTHLFEADSSGQMFSDGVKIGQTAAGNRFVVENVFGKAFIAISDGLHGQDVPLQYDGTNLDRVSQNSPGSPPNVVDSSISSSALSALTRSNGYVTATATASTNLSIGNSFTLSNVAPQAVPLSQIVVNNVQNAGVATVTTPKAH